MERSQSMSSAPGKAPAGGRGAIRGILFDKDGTLLDFWATWLPAYRSSAEKIAGSAGGIDAEWWLLSICTHECVYTCHRAVYAQC